MQTFNDTIVNEIKIMSWQFVTTVLGYTLYMYRAQL